MDKTAWIFFLLFSVGNPTTAWSEPDFCKLVEIALDQRESLNDREDALRLLASSPEGGVHYPALTRAARENFDNLVLELVGENTPPLIPPPAVGSRTVRWMLGPGTTHSRRLFSDWVEVMGTAGRDYEEVRLFLDRALSRLLWVQYELTAENKKYVERSIKEIIWPILERGVSEELETLDKTLTALPLRLQDRFLGAMEGIYYRLAVDPKASGRLPKSLKKAMEIFEGVARETISSGEISEDFLYEDNLGKTIGALQRAGELPLNHRFHPNNFLPRLMRDSANRPLTLAERFYLRNYAQVLIIGRFPKESMQEATPALLTLMQRLRTETLKLSSYSPYQEMQKSTAYTDLFFLMDSVEWSHFPAGPRSELLKPLRDERKYGQNIAALANHEWNQVP